LRHEKGGVRYSTHVSWQLSLLDDKHLSKVWLAMAAMGLLSKLHD
jgi:hypothetical protein